MFHFYSRKLSSAEKQHCVKDSKQLRTPVTQDNAELLTDTNV